MFYLSFNDITNIRTAISFEFFALKFNKIDIVSLELLITQFGKKLSVENLNKRKKK